MSFIAGFACATNWLMLVDPLEPILALMVACCCLLMPPHSRPPRAFLEHSSQRAPPLRGDLFRACQGLWWLTGPLVLLYVDVFRPCGKRSLTLLIIHSPIKRQLSDCNFACFLLISGMRDAFLPYRFGLANGGISYPLAFSY